MSPASLAYEEAVLKHALFGTEIATVSKVYLALCTEAIEKKMTGSTIKTEPTEGNGWKRIEISGSEKPGWEVATKAEGATGFTILKNKNEIKTGTEAYEFKKLSAGEYKLEYWAFVTSGTVGAGEVLLFGKLGAAITITSASELKAVAKELIL